MCIIVCGVLDAYLLSHVTPPHHMSSIAVPRPFLERSALALRVHSGANERPPKLAKHIRPKAVRTEAF